jgi:hypothetical protein
MHLFEREDGGVVRIVRRDAAGEDTPDVGRECDFFKP